MMNERILDIDASRNELVGWNQASSFGKILYAVGPSGRGESFIGVSREGVQEFLLCTKTVAFLEESARSREVRRKSVARFQF
jgi:hypothetical protein